MEKKIISSELVKQAGELLRREHARCNELEKQASDFVREKKAAAIAYREVELGICEPFRSYQDFQEKVANLLQDDLEVVEKALERGYTGARQVGELVDSAKSTLSPGMDNPLGRLILTGELDN